MSRLTRNYINAGSLIENLFVQMNVRFISLGDNIDSYKNPDSITNMIVAITNVFNKNYCAQTSKKIRQVFDYKRRKGLKHHNSNIPESRPLWIGVGVDCILRNRVYTGDMVQGNIRMKSFKIHIQEKLSEDEWFVVENTHGLSLSARTLTGPGGF